MSGDRSVPEWVITLAVALFGGSIPAIVGHLTGRRKVAAEAHDVASRTTREEYQALYAQQQAQLEFANRGWEACRNECTSLRLSLDLEEQKTDALERKVRELTDRLDDEVRQRVHLEWVVGQLEKKGRRG